jgi:hypothetical protein
MALVNAMLNELQAAQNAQRAQEALGRERKKAADEAAKAALKVENLAKNLAKTFDPEYALKIRLEQIEEAARQQPDIVTGDVRARAEGIPASPKPEPVDCGAAGLPDADPPANRA